jgi:hypothetical protein
MPADINVQVVGLQTELIAQGFSALGGGVDRKPSLAPEAYQLVLDGVPTGIFAKQAKDAAGNPYLYRISFAVTLTRGWHRIDIDTAGSGETCPTYFVLARDDDDDDVSTFESRAPLCTGAYDVLHYGRAHRWGWLENAHALKPTPVPLQPRECPSFDTALPVSGLYREVMAPSREGDIHRLTRLADGSLSTFNAHSYYFSTMIAKVPNVPLIDGPRGVACVQMPTWGLVDRHGGLIFADAWGIRRMSADGTVRTRCGLRSRVVDGIAANYQNEGADAFELLGDWSAFPPAERGFHEIWAIEFDPRTLPLDPTAPAINGEQPHTEGPVLLVNDSQSNRVLKLTYRKDDLLAEPVVTLLVGGVKDPWGGGYWNGLWIVAERQANRIAAYDATTGAFVRVIAQGKALGYVEGGIDRPKTEMSSRFPTVLPGVTQAMIDAEPCVLPEGLVIQDDYAYVTSYAMNAVNKINLVTGEWKQHLKLTPGAAKLMAFRSIAISDGTFGPRGTVFIPDWTASNWGMADAWLPNGTRWNYSGGDYVLRGRNSGGWGSLAYRSMFAAKNGVAYAGSSQEGIVRISKALPTDIDLATAKLPSGERRRVAFDRGRAKWSAGEYELLHGQNGYGNFGWPLPWGADADIDVALEEWGHKRPQQ